MSRPQQKPGVYPRSDSSILWIRYFDEAGKLVRESAKTAVDREAWALLDVRMKAVAARGVVLKSNCPLDAGLNLFITTQPLAPSSRTRYITSLDQWLIFFGQHNLTDFVQVTKKVMGQFVEWRKIRGVTKPRLVPGPDGRKVNVMVRRDITDATIRRDIGFLSSVYTVLLDHHAWEDHMPPWPMTKGQHKKLKESRERVRCLTPAEWSALQAAARSELQTDVMTVAYETGLREQNLAGLNQAQIQIEVRQIVIIPDQHLVRTKNMKPIVVPLSNVALAILERRLKHTHSGYAFEWLDAADIRKPKWVRYNCFAPWWTRLRKRSGVKDFRFHDFRHTFASNFMNRGGDIVVLQRIMGHRTLQQTMRYAHLLTGRLHEEMRKVDNHS
jgi:integrase